MKKEITFILVGLALIRVGFGIPWRATEKATVKTDNTDASLNLESTLSFLRNLSWLRYLASKKNSTLGDESVPSSSGNNPPRLVQKLRPNTPLSTAAETRHLVLAILHTPDALGAVDRCLDVFPSYQQPQIRIQLANTLQAIIAQILLPKKNGGGRVPAVELLIASPAVRNLIRTGKSHQLPTVMETGIQWGMRTTDQALKDLVERDMVSPQVAAAKARDRATFEKRFWSQILKYRKTFYVR